MIWTQASLSRSRRVIGELVDKLGINLQDRFVVTEAATGPFAVTASLAAVAGATVEAIAADSAYGSFADAAQATLNVADACGVRHRVKVVKREAAQFDEADIVTNLGPVRPIDATLVSRLHAGAVIALMFDACEARPDEIDLAICDEYKIAVVGTNEDHPLVDVLRYCGHLVAKMIFELEIEVLRSRIAVIGSNLFTRHIVSELEHLGSSVVACRSWEDLASEPRGSLDAAVYIDYWNRTGPPSIVLEPAWMESHTGVPLIQFVGGLDLAKFRNASWLILPDRAVPAQRMWRTLADLGTRPVIELHAAGLKAAELTLRDKPTVGTPFAGLAQAVPGSHSDRPHSPAEAVADSC